MRDLRWEVGVLWNDVGVIPRAWDDEWLMARWG